MQWTKPAYEIIGEITTGYDVVEKQRERMDKQVLILAALVNYPGSELIKDDPVLDGVGKMRLNPKKDNPKLCVGIAKLKGRAEDERYNQNNRDVRAAYAPVKAAKQQNWRKENPELVKVQKDKEKDDKYHRPFVAIDSEGMDYPGHDVTDAKGDVYREHATFLWGAQGWARNDKTSGNKGRDLLREPAWLGTEDKTPLTACEILDWLLTLPGLFGDVNFVMFSFGYDVTQILRGLPRKKVWEILKQEHFETDEDGEHKPTRGGTFWGSYSISYMKGKSFTVRLFRDPDNIHKRNDKGELVLDKNGKKQLDFCTSITIYDAFGFYSSPFVDVARSLVGPGYIAQNEFETIYNNKKRRADFDQVPFAQIQEYCALELTTLAKALTVLRDGFDKMDIRLQQWSGAGSAAGALIRKQELKKLHFSPDISKGGKAAQTKITKQQEISHHTFIGARIELLKQGHAPNTKLYGYDVVSAYPSAMQELPSMRGGSWKHVKVVDKRKVEDACILNMYRVKWTFPSNVKTADGTWQSPPFYPLPYRTKSGAILFPHEGHAWLMRDDVVAAQKWMKCQAFNTRPGDHNFVIWEAWEFTPANDDKPFAFVQELFARRAEIKAGIKKTGVYDIAELAIKLCINSIYGKFAQRLGGSDFYPPSCANPYYASAITAQCRRKICEAGLINPFAIVQFATDGIVSTRPLTSLGPIGKRLGDWETAEIDGGIFLQSGYYSFIKAEDGKATTKMRGTRKAHVSKADNHSMHDFLIGKVLPAWSEGKSLEDYQKQEVAPTVDIEQNTYITAGSAVASERRWKLAGRWAKLARQSRVHTIGVKRDLDPLHPEYYWSVQNEDGSVTLAKRCTELVPTLAARNLTPEVLSAPNKPEWLDGLSSDSDCVNDGGERLNDLRDMSDLMQGL